ncbi:hypothetical protein F5148DRAFT_132941 [Russula earlei]|uniref:Uncharacterized protein n=1 Tax=Russula earlei TaxID=71964 RepID=A0ACC0U6K5_9AGAM|nr:hypothetical protein F5148DRAFT_132941 [Russula earlei]
MLGHSCGACGHISLTRDQMVLCFGGLVYVLGDKGLLFRVVKGRLVVGGLGHVWFPRGCGGMALVVTVGGEGGGSWVGCSRRVLVLLVRCWGAGWSYGMGCVFMWEEFSLQITLAYIVIVLCIGLASRPGGWWFSW